MRRLVLQPIVWILDVIVQWTGAAIDSACDLFDLDTDAPEAEPSCWCGSEERE